MKGNCRMIICIVYVLLGICLLVAGAITELDEYWVGMGTALLFVGVLQLIRIGRYAKDAEYREKVDTERGDERNRYISGRAWAMAGYVFVLSSAAASILLRAFGMTEFSVAVSGVGCFVLVMYWISYTVLKRKY